MFNLKSHASRRLPLFAAAALGLLAGVPLGARDDAPTRPGKYEDWNGTINSLEIKESFKLGDFSRVVVLPLDSSKTPVPDADDNTHEPALKILKDSTRLWLVGFRSEFSALPVAAGDAPATPPAPVHASAAAPAAAAAAEPAATRDGAPAAAASPPVAGSAPANAPAASAPAAAPPPPRELVVKTRIVEIKPGSRAARFWIGMGAGKSRIEIAGEVVDGASGRTLLVFDVTRTTSRSGGSGLWALADPQDAYGGDYEHRMAGDLVDTGTDVGEMLARFK